MNNVAIIIPFHNSFSWVNLAIQSVKLSRYNLNDCYIVNDGSSDEELKLCNELISKTKKITLFDNEGRRGFGGTVNYAVSRLKYYKYILILNSDCLITSNTINTLLAPFLDNDNTIMSCPYSNNSPDYSFPMNDGFSFIDQDKHFNAFFKKKKIKQFYEANTIVGNCLMIDVSKFIELNGFADEWGIGYGEETDLQFRALEKNYHSYIVLNTYVYHFGGASFTNIKDIENIRKKNYQKFIKKWGVIYKDLVKRNPSRHYDLLSKSFQKNEIYKKSYDLIFYLPTINQKIGGIHSVINICNELILNGHNATIIVVGNVNLDLDNFSEPLFFSPIYVDDDKELINIAKKMNFKSLVSTIYSSAKSCSIICKFLRKRHIQFIQGVEYFFDGGSVFNEVINSYKYGDYFVFVSKFTRDSFLNIRHLNSEEYSIIPPYVDKNVFFSTEKKRKYDIAFFMRHSQDKGQIFIIKHLLSLVKLNFKIVVLGQKFDFLSQKVDFFPETLSRANIAKIFRDTETFIDFSINEGFGLVGLEAINSGCKFIYYNNGGVNAYINRNKDKFCVNDPSDSKELLKKIKLKGKNSLLINKSSWLSLVKKFDNL
jgi:GT2 family glycosyltransferase